MTSMEEAIRIKTEMEGGWLAQPGVTGVDVGRRTVDGQLTDEPVIRIYVADRRDAAKRLKLPAMIRGVHVQVIERRFELH
ncbi:MAG: hypothetical protein H0W08_23425 [Acidobacteria bacterium]|nr:hypothetical protein [Acidobacteriota bacterium]